MGEHLDDWAATLHISLERIEVEIEQLKDLLVRSGAHDSRSLVGDTLLRLEGQVQQMRRDIPKPQ